MNLVDFKNRMAELSVPVSHYFTAKKTDQYVVWAEDGEASASHANNQKSLRILSGTVDYFTKIEFDPVIEEIESKFNDMNIAWKLNSVQSEEDTGFTHYEWVWEMV